jgi:UDP-N-acetylmuramoylalanine--D-glutamate ligase
MRHWENIHNVVVAGLGITGLSVIHYLQKTGLPLTLRAIDTRDNPPGKDKLSSDIELHTGSWNTQWLSEADLIVANPGIALSTPEIQQAIEKGIPVVGDIELFAWATETPVIAITGSNGKSTVTDLTGVLANAAGVKTAIGGNIGVPALELLNDLADLYVLELSSFQLETTSSLAPVAGAFLNLSEDHMDRYTGMDDYRDAKLRVFHNAKHVVVNRDDMATYPEQSGANVVSFGFDDQQFGLIEHQRRSWLADNGKPIIAADELALVGKHNIANVLTVLALLKCAGVDYHAALDTLKGYTGLSHRCQLVAEKHGVKWVNDSKATNVASTLAALSGLDCPGTLHLLVGGVGKGADFSELAPALASLKVKLYCYGRDGEQFVSLHPSATLWEGVPEILESIAPELQRGDMVMLSPACASFDQYQNFMARGDAFAELAKQYA